MDKPNSITPDSTLDTLSREREVQMEAILERVIERVFSAEDKGGHDRFVNISRVPLICQAIVGIEERLNKIDSNIGWGVKIVLGAVILGVVALVIKK